MCDRAEIVHGPLRECAPARHHAQDSTGPCPQCPPSRDDKRSRCRLKLLRIFGKVKAAAHRHLKIPKPNLGYPPLRKVSLAAGGEAEIDAGPVVSLY
jgi:hypothetical protein